MWAMSPTEEDSEDKAEFPAEPFFTLPDRRAPFFSRHPSHEAAMDHSR